MLTPSVNATGSLGTYCQLGFYLSGTAPTPASDSTLEFEDDSGAASITVSHLLDPRSVQSSVPSGSAVNQGDSIVLSWSVETDQLLTTDAYFVSGATQQQAAVAVTGNTIGVTVPALPAESWDLQLSVTAAPQVSACTNAVKCTAEVFDQFDVPVTIQ